MNPVDTTIIKRWEDNSKLCEFDLSIKYLAIALISSMNIAVIAGVTAYLILFTPIPNAVIAAAPFVVGVSVSLAYLGLQRLGIVKFSTTTTTDPWLTLGSITANVLFGFILLPKNLFDLTNYKDPLVARQIHNDLTNQSLLFNMKEYRDRVQNLEKYGLLSPEDANTIREKIREFRIARKELRFLERDTAAHTRASAHKDMSKVDPLVTEKKENVEKLETDWATYQKTLFTPNPEVKVPDFSSKWTSLTLIFRKLFGTRI